MHSAFYPSFQSVMPVYLVQFQQNKCGLTWPERSAPSFHEQRSLSERLYREQGINIQKLLGHKSQAMADKYNDD